jgi:hypothetical protein
MHKLIINHDYIKYTARENLEHNKQEYNIEIEQSHNKEEIQKIIPDSR